MDFLSWEIIHADMQLAFVYAVPPTFWTGGIVPPTFQDTGEEFAVIRGDLW